MRIACDRGVLTNAFQTVAAIVPSRTTMDVLKNIKVEVDHGHATLIASDSETNIRYEVPDVEVNAVGQALLPTARVLSVLRELTDSVVQLEITGDAVWIRSGSSEFRLSGADPAEFPPVPTFPDEDCFLIPAGALRTLIRRTSFAVDLESTRYALGGVLFELNPERLTLAATDTRRLAVAFANCRVDGSPVVQANQPVVPARAVTLIEKSLGGDPAEDVRIAIHANDIMLRAGSTTISSRLVQGRFPDYKKVIPQDLKESVNLVVGPFYAAVRQSQIVTNEESRGVDFTFEPGTLRLNSQAADVGQSKIELPVPYAGQTVTIMFDPRYIADFLKALDSGTNLQVQFTDHDNAAVLSTDDGYRYVIMPLSRDN